MKEVLNIYQKCFDNLMAVYSGDEYYEEIKSAKSRFVEKWFKLSEGDPNHEARLQQFYDWYIYDRPLSRVNKTPIEHYLSQDIDGISESEKELYDAMAGTLRSIFNIKKIKKDMLILQDLVDRKKYRLVNCDFNVIFKPDLIIDGRLIFTKRGPILSKGFCLHPEGSSKYIKKQMKIVRKDRGGPEKKNELLQELMKNLIEKYNLHLVYRHVNIEKVYSNTPLFSNRPAAQGEDSV